MSKESSGLQASQAGGSAFAEQLAQVLPRLLGQADALPEDWEAGATTYDLPRFYAEAEFVARFRRAVEQILAEDIQEPARLRALLAECGHPYDYARLGQPLSTVYELYIQALSGAKRVVSFASRTKPFLAVLEARRTQRQAVRLYTAGELPLSEAKKQALRQQQVEIHENWQAALPALDAAALTVYVSNELGYTEALSQIRADAVCYALDEGGVLLLGNPEAIDPKGIQLNRKRTVAALLAADARLELERLAGLTATTPAEDVSEADCDRLLRQLFPQVRESAFFCTGLAAEAAVFSATAEVLAAGPVKLFYAQNGYGGTCQLISEILPRDGLIEPVPLPVLARDAAGRTVTLVDRFVAALAELAGAPACLFLETPTNPELQVHDFGQLMAALRAYQAQSGQQIPVLVDTTLAPLYPLFAQGFAQDWPFVIVKSGSKYFTKGKAILGVGFCGENPLARRILAKAKDFGRAADALAKSSQLRALAQGLVDLAPRMARIAANTRRLAQLIRRELQLRGHEVSLYTMSDEQLEAGLASGILSLYLPPAPTAHQDLVDEFVAFLLAQAPGLVKNRVSYGQSTGDGRPDPFYIINPQESTQGSLPEAVKAAQKKDNVQICRISVPEHADVEALGRVMSEFFDLKYT
ncbi:MAG TPA: PLP-dependent transferase [Candidatus Obscuribacterales bacterium]